MSAAVLTSRNAKSVSARTPNFALRRFAAALVLAILVTAIGSLFFGQGAQATNTQTKSQFQYISVHAGESLWSLAEKYAPNTDPREWIDSVVSLNQLKSVAVAPGQSIALP